MPEDWQKRLLEGKDVGVKDTFKERPVFCNIVAGKHYDEEYQSRYALGMLRTCADHVGYDYTKFTLKGHRNAVAIQIATAFDLDTASHHLNHAGENVTQKNYAGRDHTTMDVWNGRRQTPITPTLYRSQHPPLQLKDIPNIPDEQVIEEEEVLTDTENDDEKENVPRRRSYLIRVQMKKDLDSVRFSENSMTEAGLIRNLAPLPVSPDSLFETIDNYCERLSAVINCKCTVCDERFSTADKIYRHQLSHQLECPICKKFFASKVALAEHIPWHDPNPIPNVPCRESGCSATFFQKTQEVAHYKAVHEAVKKICKVCGASFPTYSARKSHYRKEHPSVVAPQKRDICVKCGQSCGGKSLLMKRIDAKHPEYAEEYRRAEELAKAQEPNNRKRQKQN